MNFFGITSNTKAPPTEQELAAEIEAKKGVVDKALTENLLNIGELLSQYSKNDTQSIVERIRNMEEFRGKIPDAILNKASNVHKNILDTIDSTLTDAAKKQKMETNANVEAYIKQYVGKELDDKMKSYLENPFIKNDPKVAESMTSVTNSIKSIRGKYKYFEYKYIQMNMFLILYTKHMHSVVSKFIDETVAFYEAKEKYHLVLIRNVVKAVQEQLGDQSNAIESFDTTSLAQSVQELARSLMESITKQKDLASKMKQDSLAEMLKFLMEREKDFATQLIAGVDNYKLQNKSATTATQYQSIEERNKAERNKESLDLTNPPTTLARRASASFGGGQVPPLRGGFIRANSMLPQDFFKL
jgi:hypothetical protein